AALWGPDDISPRSDPRLHLGIRIQYALLVLLAISGLFLCSGRLAHQWPLWLVPLYFTTVHLVFHVEPRYSFPARTFLMIYAGVPAARGLAGFRFPAGRK